MGAIRWLEVCICIVSLSLGLAKGQEGALMQSPKKSLSHALSEVLGYLKSDKNAHRSHQMAKFDSGANKSVLSFWNGAKDGMQLNSEFRSKLRRRCPSYLGCTSHAGGVEIFNGIFDNNVLWLKDVDKETVMQIEALQDFYAGRKGYLPAALAKPGVWTPGPKIMTYREGDKGAPTACTKVWDTDAFFLYPWESGNAYHSLNDNLMSVLASVVLQYASDYLYEREASPTRKTLFLFRNFDTMNPTIIYKALVPLFSADVLPAKEALGRDKGPQCFRRISWGSAAKPFYKDGLAALRRVIYLVFRTVIEHSPGVEPSNNPVSAQREGNSANGKRSLKIVVVGRGGGSSSGGHKRSLHRESEKALLDLLDKRGHEVSPCCDFKRMKAIPQIMAKFGDVDICMGIHGAGLANCVFGPPGMMVFELQTRFHNFGFDSFMKVAHMTGGDHVMLDTEGMYNKKTGVVLVNNTVTDIVDLLEAIKGDNKALLRESGQHCAERRARARAREAISTRPRPAQRRYRQVTTF